MNTKLALVLAGAVAFSMASCEKKEDAAPNVVNKTKDAADRAAAATKDAANKGVDAVKDAAAKGTDSVKDAAAKGTDAVKDAAAKGADTIDKTKDSAANSWETTRNTFTTESTKVFEGFTAQVSDLSKRTDALTGETKDAAKKTLVDVTTKITEGQALFTSLKSADATTWKPMSDKVSALITQIRDGLAKVTAMLPK